MTLTQCLSDRYLYWSDISNNNPHIGRMGMDGSNRTVIVKDKISRPYGLALDYINHHIYWTDLMEKHIATNVSKLAYQARAGNLM